MTTLSSTSILQPRRILVRGVNWLGDAAMTTPALLRLRERFPEAHITLLSPEKLEDLWHGHPAVNETVLFAAGESLWSVSRKLRALHFDLTLVLPNSPRAALEVWLARIPRRVGCARPWRNCFLTNPIPPRVGAATMRKRSLAEIKELITVSGGRAPRDIEHASRITPHAPPHQIHDYLNLVAALGANPEPLAPHLGLSENETDVALQKFDLGQTRAGGTPIFGLNPGAEYGPAKRWPADRFIETAREIHRRVNCTWLVFGGKGDAPVASQIVSALGLPPHALRNLAGRTTLRELMALLKTCRVLLTNDTGPMHVAAALGTPVVVPFGSTSPELTGPGLPGDARHYLLKSNAPCAPCFLRKCPIDFRCMNGIGIERVVEAVLKAAR
jgi:heptosyltransferase-2